VLPDSANASDLNTANFLTSKHDPVKSIIFERSRAIYNMLSDLKLTAVKFDEIPTQSREEEKLNVLRRYISKGGDDSLVFVVSYTSPFPNPGTLLHLR